MVMQARAASFFFKCGISPPSAISAIRWSGSGSQARSMPWVSSRIVPAAGSTTSRSPAAIRSASAQTSTGSARLTALR